MTFLILHNGKEEFLWTSVIASPSTLAIAYMTAVKYHITYVCTFDKTGTLTQGKPTVTQAIADIDGMSL